MATDHPKRAIPVLLAAVAAMLLAACGSAETEPGEAPDFDRALAGAPPPLADLYEQGNEVIEASPEAFERRLEELEGYPVVVNKWASWCVPCRAEFPHFQSQAAEHGTEVAFLGVDSDDSTAAAETFLRDNPVPYPSYSDPDEKIAELIEASFAFPSTTFFDASGKIVHVKAGQYASEEDLAADIRTHALGR